MNAGDQIKTQLRLSAELQERLKESADESGRSMNGEIVHRLEESFSTGQLADNAIHANLLVFQLGAALMKHEPEMVPVVIKFFNLLFGGEKTKRRVYEMADEGNEIAARAIELMRTDLDSMLEDAQNRLNALHPKNRKAKR